jgi:phospholipase/lecithinase/hemolysin
MLRSSFARHASSLFPINFAPRPHRGADRSHSWFSLQQNHSRCVPKLRLPSGFFIKKNPPFKGAGKGYSSCGFALAALLVLTCAAMAQAQRYSAIVVFGDSLSDTGNFAHLTNDKYMIPVPGPYANYTLGQFTDGPDTTPYARQYFNVWVDQLAGLLGLNPLVDSLDGGTNYAYGDASNGNGTSSISFGPSNSDSVTVENIGQQITDYLATHPHINNQTLFIVWGGANNLLGATSPDAISQAAVQQTLNLQRLIQAGATQFLVPNQPPLGLTPELISSPESSLAASAAALLYNTELDAGISLLKDFYPRNHLAFYQLDVFSLLLQIDASPSSYSLTNVITPAQGLSSVNPDTYLFWDDLHPTTRGHNLLADAAYQLLPR